MTVSPEKARLYKTAMFTKEAVEILAGVDIQLPSVPVRVRYVGLQWNEHSQMDENLYAVYSTMDDDSFLSTYFENALEQFVLRAAP